MAVIELSLVNHRSHLLRLFFYTCQHLHLGCICTLAYMLPHSFKGLTVKAPYHPFMITYDTSHNSWRIFCSGYKINKSSPGVKLFVKNKFKILWLACWNSHNFTITLRAIHFLVFVRPSQLFWRYQGLGIPWQAYIFLTLSATYIMDVSPDFGVGQR